MKQVLVILAILSLFSCKQDLIDKTYLVGEKAPTFENYKNYNGGTSSSSDFLGSYLYIDLWASTCYSCEPQIAALEVLKETYKDKNIKFVSISIDSDENKWREHIKTNNTKDVQLLANDSWDSEFVEAYKVTYIPKAIFIDKEGYVIESDAPWPAEDSKIVELFKDIE